MIFLYVTGTLYVLVNRDLSTLPSEADLSLNSRDSLDSEPPAENVITSTTWVNSKRKQTALWINSKGESETIPESVILSKSFSQSMGAPNVTPYYFKATENFNPNDITICTLVTHDRFPVLARLVKNYKGPVSAAIHINDDEQRDSIVEDLHLIYETEPLVRRYLDVHLIIDKHDRQFNLWRNVAKLFARTEYVMMLDVDFHICTNFRESIRQNSKAMELLQSGTAALVVPAFEFNKQSDGLDYATFPNTKKDLLELVTTDQIDMFHKKWQPGHMDTNYTQWYTSSKPYRTKSYQHSYEPYIIYKKEGTPWCDERFIGYGANKAACLFEIYISGVEYWVLPNDFLIHQTHYYPEDTRARERRYNRQLYEVFREEVCLRYNRKFKANEVWDGPRAANARKECSKLRGFRSAAANLG